MSILIFTNNYENIFKFRLDLIKSLNKKYPSLKIILLGNYDGFEKNLQYLPNNIFINNINLSSRNLSLFNNLYTILMLSISFFKFRPKLVLSFTIKPNFFSCILRVFFKYKLITNITGLGDVFINNNNFYIFLRKLYLLFLGFSDKIVCQHKSDFNYISENLKKKYIDKIVIIKGSGVDQRYFRYNQNKTKYKNNSFVFIGRIIKEKGVIELLKAIVKFNRKYPRKANFTIIGSKYENNTLNFFFDDLIKKSRVNYFPYISNIKKYILNSSFVILPSYREGVSKVIIESLSLGKPVITSNTSGCNDVISHGYNGILTSKGSINSIFKAIENSYNMNDRIYKIMCKNSYLSSKQYSLQKINHNYLELINNLCAF